MTLVSNRKALIGATAAVALALAACGGNGGGQSTDSPTTGDGPAQVEGSSCSLPEGYPAGPVEMIVPWSAGGGTDQVARSLASELSGPLGVQVNVVNRTGGGGVVGHQAMAEARPDGQTIGLVTAEIGMMHWQGLTSLTSEDIQAVSQVNADQAAVTVSADSQFETIEDLLTHIEENPGTLTSSGTAQGGIGHLAMLGMLMGADLPVDSVIWVPSEGAAPALQEVVAGGVDFIVTSSIGEVKTMLDAGEVRTLAIMAEEPDSNYPDVPLLKETGNDYLGGTWRGIVAPEGTDQEIVDGLDCLISEIVESDAFGEIMSAASFSIVYLNSQDFASFMADYDSSMGTVMEAAGLTG